MNKVILIILIIVLTSFTARYIVAEDWMENQLQTVQEKQRLAQEEIVKLTLEKQEVQKRQKREQLLRIGHSLQDFYSLIRERKVVDRMWWLYGYQGEVEFAADLARHGIGIPISDWSEYDKVYYSVTGTRSYEDAKKILERILFSDYAIGIDLYEDSDYEKIKKILNFFNSNILNYEHDLNQQLRGPAETIGLRSGDCDDWAILVSAALARVGIDSAIVFVMYENEDKTYYHAMTLVQVQSEKLPFFYYSDLTQFGLSKGKGKWYLLEPQFDIEEHKRYPEWFRKWKVVAVDTIK